MRISKRTIIVLHDLGMAAAAWCLAWLARFNFDFPYPYWRKSLYLVPVVLVVQGLVYRYLHLYRGRWRFTSVPDLANVVHAAVLGTLCLTLALFVATRLEQIPRSILVLYPVFLILLLGGPRFAYRFFRERRLAFRGSDPVQRALIIGAGRAADMLVREMLRDPRYEPVGILDDQPELHNTELQGIRVLGAIEKVGEVCRRLAPDIIVIAIPSATSAEMRRVVELCEQTGVALRTLPRLDHLVGQSAVLGEIREVAIEDLLGRERVELDWNLIASGISGRSVLVSGGGGSIGAELCRQITKLDPRRLVIFERSEPALYRILEELKGHANVYGVLGDVTDAGKVGHVMREHRPDVVFHAAAYKHVPMLEGDVREAVRNNVLGTMCLAQCAEAAGCGRFVYISTDKAVNPVNVLGVTKRVGELICVSRNDPARTRFITVRFGNVLGSDGSVVPLFREQIRRGGPVTVTHPEITRYFMTIHEACELILQAGTMGNGGEIFVLDMGEAVKISYLAEQMIRLSGAKVAVEYIGLRPGEKLFEELFHRDEERLPTAHEKILLARHPPIDRAQVVDAVEALQAACESLDTERLLRRLCELVPGYMPGACVTTEPGRVVPLRKATPPAGAA